MTGHRVRVMELAGNEIEGTVIGIAQDGRLRIEKDDGGETRVIAGDVTIAKENA